MMRLTSPRCRKKILRSVVIPVLFIAAVILVYQKKPDFLLMRIILGVIGEKTLPEPTQEDINFMASSMHVKFTVVTNFASYTDKQAHSAKLTLINTGDREIPEKQWQMFGYFIMPVEINDFPYQNGHYYFDCGLKVFHVDGNLYRFEPIGTIYKPIPKNGYATCHMRNGYHQISKSDSMPRWFLTGRYVAPKIIENTQNESLSFVSDFVDKDQYSCHRYPKTKPYTPKERYDNYRKPSIGQDRLKILPTPLFTKILDNKDFTFNAKFFVIVMNDEFTDVIQHFSELLALSTVRSRPRRKCIIVSKEAVDDAILREMKSARVVYSEAYMLSSDADNDIIHIKSATSHGVFNAFQTLVSILSGRDVEDLSMINTMIPQFKILDAPRYAYRGLHVDVARNFIPVEEIKKLLDALSMYKMNKLHLHLSDDEGWRLEIPDIPELTKIGGFRCHDPDGQECLLPFYGSGPFINSSGTGFYTVADYKDLLKYAKSRHIEVIPEFDMPGHSSATIKSIHSKAQRTIRQTTSASQYTVVDSYDQAVFKSGQNYYNNALNPCMESTYDFVNKVIVSVKKMHQDIQPLTFYHFGGDEVADGAWDYSPACDKLKKSDSSISTHYDMMQYFMRRVVDIGAKEGLSMGCWEDAMISHEKEIGIPFPRNSFKNEDIYVYVWKRPTEKSTPHRSALFINSGYKVILAYGSYLYFDHPYEPDPEERGLYWATRKISTKDAWSLTEKIILTDKESECPDGIENDDMCFKLQRPENIIGVQAELWTETVRTNEQVDYMLFPRLLAVAERAWHKASWESDDNTNVKEKQAKDWPIFADKVGYKELHRLDLMGVKYRVAPPGAMVTDKKVRFNTEFPGQDVEFMPYDSKTWRPATHDLKISSPIWIRTISSDGKRYSREILLDPSQNHSSACSMSNIPFFLVILKTLCSFLLTVLYSTLNKY